VRDLFVCICVFLVLRQMYYCIVVTGEVILARLRATGMWMTSHPPSVLWHS